MGLLERLKLQRQAGRQCSPACTSHHTGGADKPGRMHVQLPASCWQPRAARQQHTQVWVCDQLSCCCGVLLQVLETQGHSILSPSDRSGLHPLVVPLSTFGSQGAGMSSLRCLQQLTAPNGRLGYRCMCWPSGTGMSTRKVMSRTSCHASSGLHLHQACLGSCHCMRL
jgi:hypothetical protein